MRPGSTDEFAGAKPESIVLFGSTARGDSRADSDIDVLVVIPDEMSINRANRHLERAADKISLEFGNPEGSPDTPILVHRLRPLPRGDGELEPACQGVQEKRGGVHLLDGNRERPSPADS